MRKADQLALFLAAGLFWSTLAAEQCIYKECDCYGTTIMCDYKHFTSLPPLLGTEQSNYTSLILDMNQITTIPARSLPCTLTEISLEENPIVSMDEAAFDDSALTLATLSFSGALFTRIPDAFLHLRALTELTITATNVTDWNINAMKNIGQTLQTFYLSQNRLTVWPDCIQYFTHLTALTVTSTSIETIPDNALDSMANSLITLSLVSNSLTEVPKALSKLTALQTLYLNQNNIGNVTWLPATAKLRYLGLDDNRISDAHLLSQLVSSYADTLDDFSITSNRLTVIPDFSFLKNIQQFYFISNRINDPYSGSLPLNISSVSFANNTLPSIPTIILKLKYVNDLILTTNIIHSMLGSQIPRWINMIEIDYNFITEITETSFPENSSLTLLNMNYNPVSRISVSAFKNVPLLSELTIQGSKLTRVPLAFTSLDKINFLDISDIPGLVCTCAEYSLGPWFRGFSEYEIAGYCGEISVYFFFVILSPSCPRR